MKGFIKALALAAIVAATGAQAADLSAPAGYGGYKDAYVTDTWWQPGDVFVRVRAEALLFDTTTSNWKIGGSAVSGYSFTAQNTFLPELDLSYFFTKNIAVELVCCVDDVDLRTSGKATAFGPKVGDSWIFPPTLLLQYHFDGFGALKPYVGAGVNVTAFFDEHASGQFNHLTINTAVAPAVQVGADYHLFGNWFANVDFKYLWLDTDWKVNYSTTPASGHVQLDTIIAGAGIGYRFGTGYVPLK
jgi:outer membrane protein